MPATAENEIQQLARGLSFSTVFLVTPFYLYTAPTTHKAVITSVNLRCTLATLVTGPPTIEMKTSVSSEVIFAQQQLIGAIAVNDMWTFVAEGRTVLLQAGESLQQVVVSLSTLSGVGDQQWRADVFGYLVS